MACLHSGAGGGTANAGPYRRRSQASQPMGIQGSRHRPTDTDGKLSVEARAGLAAMLQKAGLYLPLKRVKMLYARSTRRLSSELDKGTSELATDTYVISHILINAPEGCPHGTHPGRTQVDRTAYTRGPHSRQRTHTNTHEHKQTHSPHSSIPHTLKTASQGQAAVFSLHRPDTYYEYCMYTTVFWNWILFLRG